MCPRSSDSYYIVFYMLYEVTAFDRGCACGRYNISSFLKSLYIDSLSIVSERMSELVTELVSG